MFSLYYAGRKSIKEIEWTGTANERTEHGNTIVNLGFGLDCYVRFGGEPINTENILKTHAFVATLGEEYADDSVEKINLEKIFVDFQGDNVSEDFSDFIWFGDATHTSMSVGDIVLDNRNGDMYFCNGCGWVLLS